MGLTAGILTVIQTGLSAKGSFDQARALQAQGRYSQLIANQNATVSDAQAADAIARGQTAESRFRGETAQTIGSQRAALAAQGLDVGSGSAMDIQQNERTLGELDALTIRNNAAREAYGYKVQGQNLRAQGILDALGGEKAAEGARNAGYSTLLSGAADTYGLFASRPKADLRTGNYRVAASDLRRRPSFRK